MVGERDLAVVFVHQRSAELLDLRVIHVAAVRVEVVRKQEKRLAAGLGGQRVEASDDAGGQIRGGGLRIALRNRKRAAIVPPGDAGFDLGHLVPVPVGALHLGVVAGGGESFEHRLVFGLQGAVVGEAFDPGDARRVPAGENRGHRPGGVRGRCQRPLENDGTSSEGVEVGARRPLVAIEAEVVRAQRVDDDQHDVPTGRVGRCGARRRVDTVGRRRGGGGAGTGASSASSGASPPSQLSSMPFPGTSLAAGPTSGFVSSQSPPASAAEAPSPSRSNAPRRT
jgi:hypothetical protein